jgi:hypothetical protein
MDYNHGVTYTPSSIIASTTEVPTLQVISGPDFNIREFTRLPSPKLDLTGLNNNSLCSSVLGRPCKHATLSNNAH